MNTNDDLTVLRAYIRELNEDEKLALVGFLSLECTTQVAFPVFQNTEYFRESLKSAFEASTKFDRAAKLSFAIELLRFCQDAEEDEDDSALDESCDGYPGYWDEDCG
jgi:hypothetical protein